MTDDPWPAIRHVARFLVDSRDNAERNARTLNARAKINGHDFDRRADAAEGAQGAFAVTISALTGALGRSIDDLTADTPPVMRPMERPTLPGELTDVEGDALTRQALIAEDDAEQ